MLGQYYCPGVRKLGSQALAAHGLFSCLRLCWNAATPHSFTYRLSFQVQWRGQVVSKETTWLTKPKIFTTKYWLFIGKKKKKPPLPLFKETTHFLQIPPIFHRCPFPAAGCRTALASGLRQGHVLALSSVTLTVLKSAAQVFSRMLLIWGLSHLGRGCRFLGRGPLRHDVSMSWCLIRGR